MTALQWNGVGDRFFQAGVDRGVLYPHNEAGVPWNGLISVNESSNGGAPRAYYVDGVKYLNVNEDEEFVGSIEAYTYPDEFAKCDGSYMTDYGFIVTQQQRMPFNLSYRTRIGNDVDGLDHGYRIHLVFNALTSPSDKNFKTIDDSVQASTFSWNFTTTPVFVAPGLRVTSHIIIDTRFFDPFIIEFIESALYGSLNTDPKFFSVEELINLVFNNGLIRVVDNMDGTWTVFGTNNSVKMLDSDEFQIDSTSVAMVDKDTYTLSSS